jgi:hypothetical protein
MPGLVPGIHVLLSFCETKTWMAGTSPGMTQRGRHSLLELVLAYRGAGGALSFRELVKHRFNKKLLAREQLVASAHANDDDKSFRKQKHWTLRAFFIQYSNSGSCCHRATVIRYVPC